MKLYSFWRSLASFRVRIALKFKNLDFDVISKDLLNGDQFNHDYISLNPQGMVPALVLDAGGILTQSIAILEYLEEVYPDPPLMPQDPIARARVRAISMIAVADTHPLVVPRIRKYMTQEIGLDEELLKSWIVNWSQLGLSSIEAHLTRNNVNGSYCEGDTVTLADLCLIPQVGSAEMYGVSLDPYPNVLRVFKACMELPEFFDSRPQVQPDFPKEGS
jgi:maleylacetoacetate isomerase